MSTSHSLYARRCRGITLAGALEAPGGGEARALLYTPAACRFAVYRDGGLTGPDGAPVPDLAQVFEARVFCADWELRWLRDPAGAGEGDAVLLAERELAVGWDEGEVIGCSDRRANHYLLWGLQWEAGGCPDAPAELAAGWSMLASSRVGCLAVPCGELAPGQRVCITGFEYFGPAPGEAGEVHGNVVVLEERFTGFAVWQPPARAADGQGAQA